MNRFSLFSSLFAFVVVGLLASPAFAASETDPFTVTASVTASCSVLAGDLAFGAYDPVEGADVAGTSSITVTCSNGATWTLGLSAGQAASFAPRAMSNGAAASLNYNLFKELAHTNVWGEGAVGSLTLGGTGTGGAQVQTVYGLIPSGQTGALVASYTDTITATINY